MAHRKKPKQAQLLKELETTPIVSVACQKVGISRATVYRWMEEDEGFADAAREAKNRGVDLVNDMAESQLIKGIRDDKTSYVMFWLRNNHTNYGPKSVKDSRIKSMWERQPIKTIVEFVSPPHKCSKCGGPCDDPGHH